MGYRSQGKRTRHTYSHIDLDERGKIARWRMAGISVEIIPEKLGRDHETNFASKRTLLVLQQPHLAGHRDAVDVF